MTTDAKATYYDLDINGATIETRDIVRAVLERAGLGADASHQLGKLLERAIRLGAKPGTDVARECEKIAIEAGMLRDAAASPVAEAITDDDAEDETRRVERCETCDAKVTTNRQGCPICGAPTCCYSCCSREELKRQLGEARARIADLERERDELEKTSNYWHDKWCELRERDEARANYGCAEEELRHLKAGYIKIKDELTAQRCAANNANAELAALRDRYRPRRQSEEPAPDGVRVMVWSNDDSPRWMWRDGQYVNANETWTHQPPAPERKGE